MDDDIVGSAIAVDVRNSHLVATCANSSSKVTFVHKLRERLTTWNTRAVQLNQDRTVVADPKPIITAIAIDISAFKPSCITSVTSPNDAEVDPADAIRICLVVDVGIDLEVSS